MADLKQKDPHRDMMKKQTHPVRPMKMRMPQQGWLYLFVLIISCLPVPAVMALGTPPGTNITNQATVTFILEGGSYAKRSNIAVTRVDELVDVSVVWQDTADVMVKPGDTLQVLTFTVANTGNGTETFLLAADSATGEGAFDPSLVNIYLDSNGNGRYDTGVDLPYGAPANAPVLTADGSTTVFVLNDIPDGLADGDRGISRLTATSETGTGVPGSVFTTAGDGGTDAVLGASGGRADAAGTYLVSSVTVSVVKSAQIADPMGGTEPVTGALITYAIRVTVSGSGTAEGLVITDSIPENTTYKAGTLVLNSLFLSDAADTDPGDVNASLPGFVYVDLGDMTSSSPMQLIQFTVTID